MREAVTLKPEQLCEVHARKSPGLPERSVTVHAAAGTRRRFSLALLCIVGALCAQAAARKSPKVAAEKSSDTVPRFTIHPNDIRLSVSQTQRFGVSDAGGKPVSVHWKISGVGCGATACGTIDDTGAYHAPQSVSRPLVVMLEGIPVSDSEYPAFARIQLAPGTAPNPPAIAPAEPTVVTAAPRDAPSQSVDAQQSASSTQGVVQQGVVQQSAVQQAPVPPVAIARAQEDESVSQPATTEASTAPEPVVTYRNGRLAINAVNQTLASVLQMVSQKTGAIIDVPPGTGLERIVEHSGPAPASDVLTQLLKGSHFNFVLVGSPQRPSELRQVLLTVRAETDTPAAAVAAVAAPPLAASIPAEPEPEPETTAPTIANGFGRMPPQDGQPSGHMSEDELRELLKERARAVREGRAPGPPPPPQ